MTTTTTTTTGVHHGAWIAYCQHVCCYTILYNICVRWLWCALRRAVYISNKRCPRARVVVVVE